ncbi:unnamed protein product [Protopolystoma xenopodis]|uniref:Uncharacterized protein n=1 Tax=Protopolystoma xenopodis TaxID=117903 RepID=A0A3S4ZTT9_9PLAT|nr:unnamed protein product [Protopolystoma xenopodis]
MHKLKPDPPDDNSPGHLLLHSVLTTVESLFMVCALTALRGLRNPGLWRQQDTEEDKEGAIAKRRKNRMLHMHESDGAEATKKLYWEISISLLFVYVVLYLCLFKGVKWLGKSIPSRVVSLIKHVLLEQIVEACCLSSRVLELFGQNAEFRWPPPLLCACLCPCYSFIVSVLPPALPVQYLSSYYLSPIPVAEAYPGQYAQFFIPEFYIR